MKRLDLFCEIEEEKEVILRLEGKPIILQFPRTPQIRKFYQRYGLDWIQKFYHNHLSINSLPHEKDRIDIGY